MDGSFCRPAGVLGSPLASGSRPAGSDILAFSGSSKPLSFSIDRIMARTPEPRSIPLPTWYQPAPAGNPDACPSSLHCMIPLVPLGYETAHRFSIPGLEGSHFDTCSLPASAEIFGFGLNCTNPQEDASVSQTIGQYKLFRPRVVNQSSLSAMGTVCYLNCSGDGGACTQTTGLVNLHPMASYLLTARHKALMVEKSKASLQPSSERFSISASQQSHVQNYMKDRDQMLKGSAAAVRLGASCHNSKPKVFTCEVCGKVSVSLLTNVK